MRRELLLLVVVVIVPSVMKKGRWVGCKEGLKKKKKKTTRSRSERKELKSIEKYKYRFLQEIVRCATSHMRFSSSWSRVELQAEKDEW